MNNFRLPLKLDYDLQLLSKAQTAERLFYSSKIEYAESGRPTLHLNDYTLLGDNSSAFFYCDDYECDCGESFNGTRAILEFIEACKPAMVVRLMDENKRLREQINAFHTAYEDLGYGSS